jgi:hypothetical protein
VEVFALEVSLILAPTTNGSNPEASSIVMEAEVREPTVSAVFDVNKFFVQVTVGSVGRSNPTSR